MAQWGVEALRQLRGLNMKKGLLTVTVAVMSAMVASILVHLSFGFMFEGYTWGSVARLYSWPDDSKPRIDYQPPDLLALQRQLLDGRYDELDDRLARLQQEYLAGARPELEYTVNYLAFRSTNPEIGTALERWVAARPNSAAALLARAAYTSHLAWWTGKFAKPGPNPSEQTDWELDISLYDGVRRDLEAAIARDPRNVAAYAHLIYVLHRLGDDRLARAMRDKALAVEPYAHVVHDAWVSVLLDGPDGMVAARDYVDSVRPDFARNPLLTRLDASIVMHQARRLAKAGENHDAIDLLFEVDTRAESATVLTYRASLLRKTGSRDWAEADLNRALVYLPHRVHTLAARAELYSESGRAEPAARDFALALELDPVNARTLWKRFRSHYGWRRYPEAETDLTAGLRLRPDDPHFRFQRGHLRLKKLDNPAAAVEDLAVAVGGFPDSPNVWQYYAQALTEVDDCGAVTALAQYRRACEITESDKCRGSTLTAESRRVEKLAARLACAPSG